MSARGMVRRLVEFRAGRFKDPSRRLRYLQRAMSAEARPRTSRRSGWLLQLPLAAATLGIAIASVGLSPAARRALGLATASIAFTALPPKRATTSPTWPPQPESAPQPSVWLVDSNAQCDLYSNGLRVENRTITSTQPRAYLAFPRGKESRIAPGEWRFEPVGIVFHTTESHIAPFQEDQNRKLKRAGEGLLDYVRHNHSYHFVIDRFGRVFRIVRESDYANHAGRSIWADDAWIYLNLNQSFFGVAFEAQSGGEDDGLPVNPAQVYAGRILTEMLLARYHIADGNCVAHAQVSVNATGFSAPFHTDWAVNLPFRDLGLQDNYARPLASVALFGFTVDASYAALGSSAESAIREEAAAQGLSVIRYRETLHKRYRDATKALHARGVLGENN
jgi:hypothetical protein